METLLKMIQRLDTDTFWNWAVADVSEEYFLHHQTQRMINTIISLLLITHRQVAWRT
jgi:hypothetical protein